MISESGNSGDRSGVSSRNKQAWNELYGKTGDLVWGKEPIAFLDQFAPLLAPYLSPSSRILDAASGEGRNLEFLLRTRAAVHACDSSANAFRKLSPSVRKQVRCVQCDLAHLPFLPGSFSFVLLTDVIETMPKPETALRDLRRILAPHGAFLCNIPGCDDGIAGLDMKPLADGGFLYKGKYYYRFHDEAHAIQLLTRCGFQVITWRTCEWVEPPHPEFRPDPHRHVSRVFLSEKTDDPCG